MTLTSGVTTYKTFAFVEVREEVSEAESRNVFDNVKRAFQVKVTDEIAKPERFIVSHNIITPTKWCSDYMFAEKMTSFLNYHHIVWINAILLDKLSDVDLLKLPPVCKESAQNILRQDY